MNTSNGSTPSSSSGSEAGSPTGDSNGKSKSPNSATSSVGTTASAANNNTLSPEELDTLLRAAIAGPVTPKQQTQLIKTVRAGKPFTHVLTPNKVFVTFCLIVWTVLLTGFYSCLDWWTATGQWRCSASSRSW